MILKSVPTPELFPGQGRTGALVFTTFTGVWTLKNSPRKQNSPFYVFSTFIFTLPWTTEAMQTQHRRLNIPVEQSPLLLVLEPQNDWCSQTRSLQSVSPGYFDSEITTITSHPHPGHSSPYQKHSLSLFALIPSHSHPAEKWAPLCDPRLFHSRWRNYFLILAQAASSTPKGKNPAPSINWASMWFKIKSKKSKSKPAQYWVFQKTADVTYTRGHS